MAENEMAYKWRGKRVNKDEYAYGELVERNGWTLIYGYVKGHENEGNGYCRVDPDTVCLRIGYDEFGNELYEGDEVQ